MSELLLRKAVVIRQRLARIRAALPARAEDVLDDERLESFLSFQIFLLIQDAVDLATHLVAARGLGVPGSQREVFEMLAAHGLLARETSEAMAAMSSLRNRIAHAYGDIDPVRLIREAPVGLDQVEKLVAELAARIPE